MQLYLRFINMIVWSRMCVNVFCAKTEHAFLDLQLLLGQPLEHISRALSKPSSIKHAPSSKSRVAARARHRGSRLLLPFAGRGLRKAPLLISRHFVHIILHGGMTRQCLSVHLVELPCERQSHAQHVRLTAPDEVLPSGQILEGRHGEAL